MEHWVQSVYRVSQYYPFVLGWKKKNFYANCKKYGIGCACEECDKNRKFIYGLLKE